MNKIAVIQITDTLTTAEICERLGVSTHSVRYARGAGSFPASWYAPLSEMCGFAGLDCPMNAFNWRVKK